jgi:hypothetical protein
MAKCILQSTYGDPLDTGAHIPETDTSYLKCPRERARRPRHPSEASVGEDVDECPVRTGYVGGDLVDLLRFEQQLLSDIAWEA